MITHRYFFSVRALLIAFFCLFGGLFSLSNDASAQKTKKVYATEAVRGLSAYFTFFSKQTDFIQLLSEEERRSFQLLRNLLTEYEYSRHPKGGGVLKPFPLEVHFSEDQSIFKLNPNEPHRSAITSGEKLAPIIFNSLRLNDDKTKFLDVIQIVIHEIGHKLGDLKNQTAIDTLAAKVRSYLESFYLEMKSANGYSVQLLSLPIENQTVKAAHDFSLNEIHLFIETGSYIDRVPYNIFSNFPSWHETKSFISHPNGSGNILANQTYSIRDIIDSTRDDNLSIKLVLEVQSRLMFMSPTTTMSPGPIIGDSQALYSTSEQMDLIHPQSRIIEAPIYAYINFLGEFAFNFTDLSIRKWMYPLAHISSQGIKAQITTASASGYEVEVFFENSDSTESSSIPRLEISSQEGDYSYLLEGSAIGHGRYLYKLEKQKIPQDGGKVERLIFDNSTYLPLSETLSIEAPPKIDIDKELKVGRVSLSDGGKDITYDRSKKIAIESSPVTLNLPINFHPTQVRLRWIKGTELEWTHGHTPPLPIGRLSSVVEELIQDKNIKLIRNNADADFPLRLQIHSRDVHKPKRVSLLEPTYFGQRDEGLRELKEIILISQDGRMVHYALSANESIYNEEYLKVRTCRSIIGNK